MLDFTGTGELRAIKPISKGLFLVWESVPRHLEKSRGDADIFNSRTEAFKEVQKDK
jgi:hypothetical protein